VEARTIYQLCISLAFAGILGVIASRFAFSSLQIAALFLSAIAIGFMASTRLLPTAQQHQLEAPKLPGQTGLTALEVLEVFPNPSVVFDAQGIATIVNPAAKIAFRGLDIGIGFNQWFRDTAILEAVSKVKTTGKAVNLEFLEKRPLDRAFRVDIAPVDLNNSSILMVFTEHTEALRVDRMRADFIANASHELRTPLTAVTGFLETLQGPARNDTVNRERFIVLMLDQTQRMARLIDDLLSLSRFESRSVPAKVQSVDIGLLAATTMNAMAGLAAKYDVVFENALLADALIVPGDPDELTQVLQNLIENAIKYGASGSRIEIGITKPNGLETGFFVRDFGNGIPSEHIPRLTERFYRVDVEASRQQKGTGLGLAIVKHILTRHRARLIIESRQGAGSTFSVLFPNPI
jgi:two-component system, OmpR family, phosphate regulon sensor histidine kinase PhoR